MLQYPHLPHLPPLMTQLGQSGANAAQPYYFMGGGSSVRGPSMLSVQATCSMRLPPSTAQQLAAPGVPPRTQLPPASLASTATAAAAPLPAADHAALIDPFTRPHAALVEQQPPAELQPPAFASHAAYCGQHGGQPHWFLPPDGATSWTPPGPPGPPGASGASWVPPGAPGAVLPATCGLPHPSAYPAPDGHCHFFAHLPPRATPSSAQPDAQPAALGPAALGFQPNVAIRAAGIKREDDHFNDAGVGTAPPAHLAVRPPAPPQPLPGAAADSGSSGGGGLPSGGLLGYDGGLTSSSTSYDGAGAAARSPDLELNLSSLAGLAGLSGDRDLQIAGLSGLPALRLPGFGSAPHGAATNSPPLAVSDDQSGAGQLLPELFL
jgi:hypothetical protein